VVERTFSMRRAPIRPAFPEGGSAGPFTEGYTPTATWTGTVTNACRRAPGSTTRPRSETSLVTVTVRVAVAVVVLEHTFSMRRAPIRPALYEGGSAPSQHMENRMSDTTVIRRLRE
jgi:hypothetical protein